jgi:hypothetical protein
VTKTSNISNLSTIARCSEASLTPQPSSATLALMEVEAEKTQSSGTSDIDDDHSSEGISRLVIVLTVYN